MDAVDEALKDKGISTEGFTPEDYKNAIDEPECRTVLWNRV